MKKKFLYQQIADDIRLKMKNGSYQTGSLLDPPDTLSKWYSVSTITINKALLLLAEDGYIKRIPGKGSVVYSPDEQELTPLVGAIVYDMAQSGVWAPMLRGIEVSLFQHDYQLLVGNNFDIQERMVQYIDRFVEQGARGLIIVPLSGQSEKDFNELNEEVMNHLEEIGLPFVILYRVLTGCTAIQVGFDNLEDMALLTRTLLAWGVSNPLLLSNEIYDNVIVERERGYCEAMAREGFTAPIDRIIRIPQKFSLEDGDSSEFGHFLAAQMALYPHVDALIAVDDQILTLLNTTLLTGMLADSHIFYAGFGKPYEGFDRGAINLYQYQDPTHLGTLAAERLLNLIQGDTKPIPHILRIPSTLVEVRLNDERIASGR